MCSLQMCKTISFLHVYIYICMPKLFCVCYIQMCRHINSFDFPIFFLSYAFHDHSIQKIYIMNTFRKVCAVTNTDIHQICAGKWEENEMDEQRGEMGLNSLCLPCIHAFEHIHKTHRQHSPIPVFLKIIKNIFSSQGKIWSDFVWHITLCLVI